MSTANPTGLEHPVGQSCGTTPTSGETMQEQAQQVAARVREAAQQQYEEARERATEYYEMGREQTQQWAEQVEKYIRREPLKAVAIAAGVGALFGFLVMRR
jgi:ElaB/YqjD/DUF883 family membrane-anchored ribosome-binding protein